MTIHRAISSETRLRRYNRKETIPVVVCLVVETQTLQEINNRERALRRNRLHVMLSMLIAGIDREVVDDCLPMLALYLRQHQL